MHGTTVFLSVQFFSCSVFFFSWLQLLSCLCACSCLCVCVYLHCLLKVEEKSHDALAVQTESSSRAFINASLLDLNSLQTENSPQLIRLPGHHLWHTQAQSRAPELKAPARPLEVCCSPPALRRQPRSPRKGEAATLPCPRICSLFWPGASPSAPSLEVIPRSNKARDCRGG